MGDSWYCKYSITTIAIIALCTLGMNQLCQLSPAPTKGEQRTTIFCRDWLKNTITSTVAFCSLPGVDFLIFYI